MWFSWEEYTLDPVWEAEEKRLRNTREEEDTTSPLVSKLGPQE